MPGPRGQPSLQGGRQPHPDCPQVPCRAVGRRCRPPIVRRHALATRRRSGYRCIVYGAPLALPGAAPPRPARCHPERACGCAGAVERRSAGHVPRLSRPPLPPPRPAATFPWPFPYAHSFGAQPSLWGWLEAPTVPVLYAAGELDGTYSSIARQLAAASLPQSRLQVSLLPHAAHAVLVQARWRVCVRAKRTGRACVLRPTHLRAGFKSCRGALP